MPIQKGCILPPYKVRELIESTGQNVHPEIYSTLPTGNLIYVVPEKAPETHGLIKLPAGTTDRPGMGYIIAAGPQAGDIVYTGNPVAPVGIIADKPQDLLGLHVVFGASVGMPLRMDITDREFMAAVLIMTSKDIRAVDSNPESLVSRIEKAMLKKKDE